MAGSEFRSDISVLVDTAAGLPFKAATGDSLAVVWTRILFMEPFGLQTSESSHSTFGSDIMLEAEAKRILENRDLVPGNRVTVLIVAGDNDAFLPAELSG